MAALPAHLENLLSALRRRGFPIGPQQVLRMHRLLALMPPGSLEDLRLTLGPILTSSEKEQVLFRAAFEEVFPQEESLSRTDALRRQRRAAWVFSTLGVVLCIGLGFWLYQQDALKKKNRELTESSKLLDDARRESEAAKGKVTSVPEVEPKQPTASDTPRPETTAPAAPVADPPLRAEAPPSAAPPAYQFTLHPWVRKLLLATVPGLPLALVLLGWWARRPQPRSEEQVGLESRQDNDQPPYVWPIVFEAKQQIPDFRSPLFQQVMRKLRRRLTVSGRRLDVARTTTATIREAGYPTMVYRPDSRAPEYLVLIDREGWNDHAAEYFTELSAAMESDGLYVERWYFENDARACQSGNGQERRLLTDLARRFSDYRLLLFTSGAGMLSPRDGSLLPWTQQLQSWSERALLSPVPEEAWGLREERLGAIATVAPASVAGLDLVADWWTEGAGRRAELVAPDPEAWDSWIEPQDLDRLRTRLGPVFPWAAACALYPELHWPLTLRLGSLPEVGRELVNEQNLLRLARIPWFREGSIPAPWREQLREAPELSDEGRRAVRTTLIELLEKEPEDPELEGSAAADARRLEIAVSRALLDSLPRAEREKAQQYVRERGGEDRLPRTELAAQQGVLSFRTPWRRIKGLRERLRGVTLARASAAAVQVTWDLLRAVVRPPKSPHPVFGRKWPLAACSSLLAGAALAWGICQIPESPPPRISIFPALLASAWTKAALSIAEGDGLPEREGMLGRDKASGDNLVGIFALRWKPGQMRELGPDALPAPGFRGDPGLLNFCPDSTLSSYVQRKGAGVLQGSVGRHLLRRALQKDPGAQLRWAAYVLEREINEALAHEPEQDRSRLRAWVGTAVQDAASVASLVELAEFLPRGGTDLAALLLRASRHPAASVEELARALTLGLAEDQKLFLRLGLGFAGWKSEVASRAQFSKAAKAALASELRSSGVGDGIPQAPKVNESKTATPLSGPIPLLQAAMKVEKVAQKLSGPKTAAGLKDFADEIVAERLTEARLKSAYESEFALKLTYDDLEHAMALEEAARTVEDLAKEQTPNAEWLQEKASEPPVIPMPPEPVKQAPPAVLSKPAALAPPEAPANTLGMKFVMIDKVDYCIWPTRLKDFEVFAKETAFTKEARQSPGFKQGPDHPVVNVSWNDAMAFCHWLTEREHKAGTLPADRMYRLPTDLEWSKIVGLGAEQGKTPEVRDMAVPDVFPWGDQWPPPPNSGNYNGEETGQDVAIKGYNDGYPWTSPVGSFPANKFGLFDVGGNVWQWCMDNWSVESKAKVLRGASWYNGTLKLSLLSSCRVSANPDSITDNYGFRVVRATSLSPSAVTLRSSTPAQAGNTNKPAGSKPKTTSKPSPASPGRRIESRPSTPPEIARGPKKS